MALSITFPDTRTNDQSGPATGTKPRRAKGMGLLKSVLLLAAVLLARPGQAQVPSWQWAAQSMGSGIGQLKSLAVDAEGNSYQVGFFTETIQFGSTTLVSQGRSDVFVAKLSSAGTWEWAVAVGSAGSDNAAGVAIDAAGRIFISGSFSDQVRFGATTLTSQGDMDVFVAQISPLGTWDWATAAGGSGLDLARALATTANGDVVVSGQFADTAAFGATQLMSIGGEDAFVARLEPNGQWQWAIGVGSPGNDEVTALAVDKAGDVYTTGYFSTRAQFGTTALIGRGMDDAFVGKLNKRGQWLWATVATATNTAYGKGIAVDPAGGVFVTGSFSGGAQFGATQLFSNSSDDGFVARLTNKGQWEWVAVLASDYLDSIVGIALGQTGQLHVAGTFSRTIRGGAFQLTSRGHQDVFVGSLTRQGAWLGLASGGGTATDETQAMALAPGGGLFIGGDFSSAATFGATQLQSGTAAAQVCIGRVSVP